METHYHMNVFDNEATIASQADAQATVDHFRLLTEIGATLPVPTAASARIDMLGQLCAAVIRGQKAN